MRPSRDKASRGRNRRNVQPSTELRRLPNARQAEPTGNNHRRMEHIASVSRSSGLELKDGDSLKERTVQEEYRAFIDNKLRTLWDSYGVELVQKQKKDNQENILILFRKLREGLFASGRNDGFALEVYETSLYLSVVFDSPVQTISILSRLVPYIYLASPAPQPSRLITIIIHLLHQLYISFPSQQAYLEQVKYLVPNLLEQPSAGYLWISSLARSLRTSNYVQFGKLSHRDAFEHILASTPVQLSDTTTATMFQDLPRNAVHALVYRLRLKVRERAWIVARSAYREFSSSTETQKWLGKRLFFDSFGSEETLMTFDKWVRERCQDGHLRPREGVDGRWIVCRAR